MNPLPKPRTSQPTRRRTMLRVSPIAAACSTLLMAAGGADAQQAPAAGAVPTQTVVVTGIRRSIESSIAIKRNADSIVEAISPEDLGKLPDASIAEALSRLPGLTGQRGADGRTTFVSIRGLPPLFGATLLNGREVVSSNDGRAVEFDQFPSELTNGAKVYKTSDAGVVGQGVAGTMDVITIRPLDSRGRRVAANVALGRNSNGTMVPGVASDTDKRFSFSYIDQFADNTVGVALGYARLDQATQLKQFQLWDFAGMDQQWRDWGASVGGVLPPAKNINASALMPMGLEATAATKRNTRDGFMAVLEYKPNKDLNTRLDLFYSKFDTHEVGRKFMVQTWAMWDAESRRPVLNNARTTEVGLNTIVTSGTFSQMPSVLQNFDTKRQDKVTALGWNTNYKFGPKWSADLDVSMSRDVRDESYLENFTAPYANGQWTLGSYDFNVPVGAGLTTFKPSQNFTSLATMKMGDPFNWVDDGVEPGFAGNRRTPHITDDIKALRLSGKREMDGMFSRLDFGANYLQRDKKIGKNEVRLIMPSDGAGGFLRDVPASAVSGTTSMSLAGIPGVMGIDVPELVRSGALVEKAVYWNKAANDSAVHEKVTTLYGKLSIDTEFQGMALTGNIGVQAIHTKQNANGWVWLGNDKTPDLKDLYALSGGASYWDVLPSMNFKLDLPNSVYLRFGLGKSLSRPEMNDMRAGSAPPKVIDDPSSLDFGRWVSTGAGNPELKPWRATATDLELTKYFDKRSMIMVAGFHKRMSSTIYNQTVLRDFTGIPNNNTKVEPISPIGKATALANGRSGSLSGQEGTVQLDGSLVSPAMDGIGVSLSGSLNYQSLVDDKGDPLNLDGASGRTNNLTVYYERNGLTARVSQRYRSAYRAMERGWDFNPTFRLRPSEKLLDLQLGYNFETGPMKGLSLLLQVYNATDEVAMTYKTPNHAAADMGALLPNYVNYFGRHVSFALNYKL